MGQLNSRREREQVMLGLILWEQGAMEQVRELTPEDFRFDRHKLIFQAAKSLCEGGLEVGPLTVVEKLEEDGALEAAGGVSYITYLPLLALELQAARDREETDLILRALRSAGGAR
jgi:replicative DNA helicase